jgi:hypothetical protein
LCERRRGSRRGVREGACIGVATMPQPWTLRLILNAAAMAAASPQVCFISAGPITKLFAWGGEDSGGHVLRETTSRGLCGLVCSGTREEPGTLTQGAPVFPGSSRLGIEPKTPRWLVQDPTTRPIGTREEPGTLTQSAPVFPGSSRLGIEPKTPRWLVHDPTTRPIGTREEPGTLTQGAAVFPVGPVRIPVLSHRVRLFSLVPLLRQNVVAPVFCFNHQRNILSAYFPHFFSRILVHVPSDRMS